MPVNFEILQKRSELLARLRQFFLDRQFIEVETPLISCEVIPELHIEPRSVSTAKNGRNSPGEWLQASPELHMKRLLAAGMEAIFQVTRSFRGDERGTHHHPEFTIVEWYRIGDDMQDGMNLLDELMQTLLGTPPARLTSYKEAFEQHVGVNPHQALANELASLGFDAPAGMPTHDRDQWLNFLLASRVEPHLGTAAPEILCNYPASQAALATITQQATGELVAERFELYWQGVELANGYHELTDAAELRTRLEMVNAERETDGRESLPLPELLLSAMESGLPACAGCALGFDRMVMLACGQETLAEVLPFQEG